MTKHGKKYQKAVQGLKPNEIYKAEEALKKLKELSFAKFDESVDVHVNLSIDASRGEQAVRGSVLLPYGRGKEARVIVFAKGDYAEEAQKAGANFVGADDLVEKINAGWLEFDYAVATPDLMGLVGKLAKILGPRGLLPNKKVGTVTFEVADVVKDLKKGRLFFKNDKSGLVHFVIGKKSFDVSKLQENLMVFLRALTASKPASAKGKFLQKVTVTTTMGPGLQINPDELLRTA
jgi:large subunit ribosomal protein L1